MACLVPYHLKTGERVPCGKCIECVKRRVSAWSFRLREEFKRSDSAHFVTLTYNTERVPISQKGYMNLSKRDLQLFFKRLRKQHEKVKGNTNRVKYYACGEYGGKTMRPHYHIILYNSSPNIICEAWKAGNIHFGTVNAASIGYCLKYISKVSKVPLHGNDDRQKEFALMSKRLGDNYLRPSMINWHKADLETRMYLNLEDGKRCSMPRYYKDKMYSNDERERVGKASQQRAIDEQMKLEEEWFNKYGGDVTKMRKEFVMWSYEKMQQDSLKRDKI